MISAAGHPLLCSLCLGDVASCEWHQSALARRFDPDVGLLLDFEGIQELASLCQDGVLAAKPDLGTAATALSSAGTPSCKPLRFRETCTSGRALSAFHVPSMSRGLLRTSSSMVSFRHD